MHDDDYTEGARLEVSDPTSQTRVVPIEFDRFTIGRSHGNSLSLGSAEISRFHAEIVNRGDSYILRDLGSPAGTFINDETVIERALGHGDRIRIGQHSDLRFMLEDSSETATRSTTSGVGDLRQTATLLEWLRALGTAKVIDQVLEMVIDYAITLSGAERGFIMLVNPAGALEFTLGRGRGQDTLSGDTFRTSRKIPEQVFATAEPQLVGKNGVRRLKVGGLIVGLFDDAEYEQEVVTLSPGDTLITFSDGVSEAMDAQGTEFGDERILECLHASPNDIEPRELVEKVMAGVREFTVGEPQSDDITLLVVRYRGAA